MNIINRIFNNFVADEELLFCDSISFINKLIFIIDKYISIVLNMRNVRYLGINFEYDTRAEPAILQFYPVEINTLDKYVDFNNIKSVLDIGANVGQWAFTAKYFFPQLKIYSFEPNKIPYLKLKINSAKFDNWKVYNYAIGRKTQNKNLYYTNNSTVGGSFYKDITEEFLDVREVSKTTRVSVIQLNYKGIKSLDIPTKYDLVKIDVEGAELEVLESLRFIDFKYLVIEVPLKSKREVSIKMVNEVITKKLNKKANLLFINPIGNMDIVADAIYKLS